ncbi:hypothetical protein N8H69_16985 [Achromobacter spanius]|uniref:hypothetical protein n=1 Tax=Achromobacter spanius TaxID=217203 RepID=UPI002227612F|nr:hypothetical protein [Achromobacter spanius]MCW3154240.1 hypothetical protein [Achromobacter spanius]
MVKKLRAIDPATIPDAAVEFKRQCERLDESRDYAALPDIRYAMDPEQLWLTEDVSDPAQFNDQYIEPRTEGQITFLLQLSTSGVSVSVSTVFILAPLFGEYQHKGALICIPFFLMAAAFLWLGTNAATSRIRFNRQAQLVHVCYGDTVLHLPWRDVRPYTEFGHGYTLRLCFPRPYLEMMQLPSQDPDSIRKSKRPFIVEGDFDAHDQLFFDKNLHRLEFIRRYMEHGLKAIEADPKFVAKGLVRKPTGDNNVTKTGRWTDIFNIYDILFNLFTLKPLLDRWIKHKANSFRWPEEVERLCAPGADLSAYDTRPVKSSTRYFYRYAGMDKGIIFVDHKGKQVHLRSRPG